MDKITILKTFMFELAALFTAVGIICGGLWAVMRAIKLPKKVESLSCRVSCLETERAIEKVYQNNLKDSMDEIKTKIDRIESILLARAAAKPQ